MAGTLGEIRVRLEEMMAKGCLSADGRIYWRKTQEERVVRRVLGCPEGATCGAGPRGKSEGTELVHSGPAPGRLVSRVLGHRATRESVSPERHACQEYSGTAITVNQQQQDLIVTQSKLRRWWRARSGQGAAVGQGRGCDLRGTEYG